MNLYDNDESTPYTIGFDDARTGDEPFDTLNWEYMQGYNAGLISKAFD